MWSTRMQGARTVRRVPLWYIAHFTVVARPSHFAPCCALLRLDTPDTPDTPDTLDTPDTPARARDSRHELRCVALTVPRWCCVVEWLVACSVVQVAQVLCLFDAEVLSLRPRLLFFA